MDPSFSSSAKDLKLGWVSGFGWVFGFFWLVGFFVLNVYFKGDLSEWSDANILWYFLSQ